MIGGRIVVGSRYPDSEQSNAFRRAQSTAVDNRPSPPARYAAITLSTVASATDRDYVTCGVAARAQAKAVLAVRVRNWLQHSHHDTHARFTSALYRPNPNPTMMENWSRVPAPEKLLFQRTSGEIVTCLVGMSNPALAAGPNRVRVDLSTPPRKSVG